MKDKFWLYKAMQNEPPVWSDLYCLEGHTPVKATSVVAWGVRFNYERHVKQETVDVAHWFWRLHGCHERYWISTIFLGLNHSFWGGKPMYFETMIRRIEDGNFLEYSTRCSTWLEAISMHYKAKQWLNENKTDLA